MTIAACATLLAMLASSPSTTVSIRKDEFWINGKPTYEGCQFQSRKIQGLLMNSRMVQATFDDMNPGTRDRWAYPDGPWDAERNTSEFIAQMSEWRKAGLLSFTLNLQGGSPEGYSSSQPWHNSAIDAKGCLDEKHLSRLHRILAEADRLGMAPMIGIFYFGQEPRLESEAAILNAVDQFTDWLLESGFRNVLVEVSNECDIPSYRHGIIKPARAEELIRRIQHRSKGKLLVSTSFSGGSLPTEAVIAQADYILLHGNGIGEPEKIGGMVRAVRTSPAYRGQPIVFNEDDHYDFEKPKNNFLAAVNEYASWGFFDYRMKGEGFSEGYQSVPVDWATNSARKRGFFKLLKMITQGSSLSS